MSGAASAAMVAVGSMAAGVGTASAIGLGLAAGSMVNQYQTGKKQTNMQQMATAKAEAAATKTAAQADQAMNRANQKKPDTAAALASAQQAGGAGQSGTLLTGPAGVDPNSLVLGKNTLLGM